MRIVVTCFLAFSITISAKTQVDIKPLDAELTNYDYPFPVKYIHVQVQGESLRMAYMDVQPGSPNNRNVMLLHGKNFCGSYWYQTAQNLAKYGYRVIIPDQIGFGKSSKPQRIQYTFHLLATLSRDLLDTLRINKVSVVGHSMGGMLATRFSLMFPDRTEKLILENPIGLEDWKIKVPYQIIEKWYENELKQTYEKIKKYQLQNYYGNQWKPEYDKWVKVLAGWTIGPDHKIIAWNAALTYDMVFTQPVYYEFENIKVPTLLIIGQWDRTAVGKNLVHDSITKTMGNYPELGRHAARRSKDRN